MPLRMPGASKLAKVVEPGADATANTAALNTALTEAAAAGVPTVPIGTFPIAGTITLPAGTNLIGHAATIQQTADLTPAVEIAASEVRVTGLTIEGKTTDYVAAGAVYDACGFRVANGASDVRLADNTVTGCAGCGVNVTAASAPGLVITGNTLVGPGPAHITSTSHQHGDGVRVLASSGWRVVGNDISGYTQGIHTTSGLVEDFVIRDNRIHDIPGQHGMYLGRARRAVISGNLVRNTGLLGMKIQIDNVGDSQNVAIVNNVFTSVGDTAILLTNTEAAPTARLRRIVIAGNIVDTATNDGVQVNNARDCRIAGNTIRSVRNGVRVVECADLTVEDNHIDTTTSRGVELVAASAVADVRVRRNTIKNATSFGIYVGPAAVNVQIAANRFDTTTTAAIYVETATDHAQLEVTDNQLRNVNTSAGASGPMRFGGGKTLRRWAGNDVEGGAAPVNPPVAGRGVPGYVGFASAAPAIGTYRVGDVVWNTAPAAGGTVGWVCVTAGSPGTWKAFGTIAA